MKKLICPLFVIILALILTACGPKAEENASSNLQVNGNTVAYDNKMYLNRPEPIAMINFNFVTVTAPEGTELNYQTDMGTVKVNGGGTNKLTISLVSSPAQVEVFVTKCAGGNCPTKVHFEHQSLYH